MSISNRIRERLEKSGYGKRLALRGFLRGHVRHFLPSFVLSLDDETHPPNRRLIDVSLEAARMAGTIDLHRIADRFQAGTKEFIPLWPGEHYRLLAALVAVVRPRLVIEIGTATGASCLCMKQTLPAEGRIVTYDITPWQRYEGAGLSAADLDGRLEQRVVDLSEAGQARGEADLVCQADFIFVDAAKDGKMEQRLVDWFDGLTFRSAPLVFFDDIRFVEMIAIWRRIRHPKLDLTSFGHWSGSGIVDWR